MKERTIVSEPGIYLASICETPRVDGAAVETRRSFQSEDRFPSAILPAATASIRAMDWNYFVGIDSYGGMQ